MKKLVSVLLAAVAAMTLAIGCSAEDFAADEDGKYTVAFHGEPDTEYALVVIAGDYTYENAVLPTISSENIIYINQVRSDEAGDVSFTDFIPMTGSVGTVLIGGGAAPSVEGITMTESGYGYIGSRLISYSGTETEVTVDPEFTEIADLAFANSDAEVIRLPATLTAISDTAFADTAKLFFSPLATVAKTFAEENEFEYGIYGDVNDDKTVNGQDVYDGANDFAIGVQNVGNLKYTFDVDFDGSVSLRDLSIILKFVAGAILDF